MRAIDLEESAADELKRELPSLKRTDYDTIDRLMQRISRRYKITGKKLHDIFVSKYGETPDHWIKKYKNKLKEAELAGAPIFVLYIDGNPSAKYTDQKEAEKDLAHLKKTFPNKKTEIRKQNQVSSHGENLIGEDNGSDNQAQIQDFIKWAYKIVNLQQPHPKFVFSSDTEEAQSGHHTGRHSHDGDSSEIWVYVGNRNLVDILRTVFHEIVHEKQLQLNMIGPNDSYPGSPIEAMADMLAGKYIKIYGKKHPEIFQ